MGKQRLEVFRRQVDLFITISQEIDLELADVGVPADRRVFIPNGVDTNRFSPLSNADKRALRISLGLPDVQIVIFAGRLVPEKGVDNLINIWPSARAVHPHAQLLVVGEGPEDEKLKRIAGDGVKFIGAVNDVVPYLQASDLFVLPSTAEGLPVALLEAMSVGLPVIATEVGGTPEVVTHKTNGWLIPSENPSVLADAVLTLLGNTDLRVNLGRQARERVKRDYALSVVVKRLIFCYEGFGKPDLA